MWDKAVSSVANVFTSGNKRKEEVAKADRDVAVAVQAGKDKVEIATSAWELKKAGTMKESLKDEAVSIIGLLPICLLIYGIFHFAFTGDKTVMDVAVEGIIVLKENVHYAWIVVAIVSSALGIKFLGGKKIN